MIRRVVDRRQYTVDWLQSKDFNNKHSDKRAFIIGGGYSISLIQKSGFDFNLLKNDITIGINKAYKLFIPTYLVIGDYYFWKHWSNEVKKLDSVVVVPEDILKGERPKKFLILKRSLDVNQTIPAGFEYPFSFINNTGVAGLRIAYILGCNPIYLLGMDIGPNACGKTHFHDDYERDVKRVPTAAIYHQFFSVFQNTIKDMKEKGTEIYSCSETSSLNTVVDYVPIISLSF